MNYEKFVMKQNNEAYATSLNPSKSEELYKRNLNSWLVHQTIQTNKKLVRITWILASTTIILSIITLFFK